MARERDKKRYLTEKRQKWIKKYTEKNYDKIKERNKLWREENCDKIKEVNKLRRKNNPERVTLYNAYNHAKNRCENPSNNRYHRY